MENVYHIPALLEPTITGLNIQPDGVYVDVTFGGGGHSRAIMERLGTGGRLFSMDQGMDAFENEQHAGEDRVSLLNDNRWQFIHGNFRYLHSFLDYYGIHRIDGLLADLGVSFHHFDDGERGFSFRFDGPLDMRMNRRSRLTAADIVNRYDEDGLTHLFRDYGEMNNARQIARRIIAAREKTPITTTAELVGVVNPKSNVENKKDLARLFQALRIEVNDELGALREMLQSACDLLAPGGRIAVLTYHSLEDRLVKNFFRSGNMDGTVEKDFYGNVLTPFKVIEKGLCATEEEVQNNPRSRSAKLRVAEKIVAQRAN